MKEAIATVPITPTENPSLGLVSIPLVTSVIADRLGINFVLALNTEGLKFAGLDTTETVDKFLKMMDLLGVSSDKLWIDQEDKKSSRFSTVVRQLMQSGTIFETQMDVVRCECLINEFPGGAKNWSQKKQLSSRVNNKCSFCDTSLECVKDDVLLAGFSKPFDYSCFPDFLCKDVSQQLEVISGHPHLVSRLRKTAIQIDELKYRLDVDTFWQNYINILSDEDCEVESVVSSNHSVRNVSMIIAYTNAFTRKALNFIALPYFKTVGPESSTSLENLVLKYGIPAVRMLILSSISWARKETVLDTSRLFQLRSSLGNLDPERSILGLSASLKEILADMSIARVRQRLSNFRKAL